MIAIVGGGICGLAIGWYLARAGRPVRVFERGAAGRRRAEREVSWSSIADRTAALYAEVPIETELPKHRRQRFLALKVPCVYV